MKLGFIGFGEVGYEISRGLKEEGLSGIVAFDPLAGDLQYGTMVRARALEAGVTLAEKPAEVAERCDVLIAATPGSKALPAALAVAAALNSSKIYVDVSTSSPKTKKKIAEAVRATGGKFVDGAMMDALSQYQHKVPTLVSGDGSDLYISLMNPYHMSLEKISDNPGDAIAIKLIRSIYMKGLASLSVELLEAASILKVESRVLQSIGDSINSVTFAEKMNSLVTASAIHAERQTHEMADVRAMLEEMGIEPTMTDAARRRLQWLADKQLKEKFQGKKPKKWEEVVQAWGTSG